VHEGGQTETTGGQAGRSIRRGASGGVRKQCPQVGIRCETTQPRALIRKVLSFDFDFAFLGDVEPDQQLDVVDLASDEILVIVAPDHPLSGRTAIPVDELANWPLIGYPDGSEATTLSTVSSPFIPTGRHVGNRGVLRGCIASPAFLTGNSKYDASRFDRKTVHVGSPVGGYR
jgi:DNA-binding transcriptional LysR family regulator